MPKKRKGYVWVKGHARETHYIPPKKRGAPGQHFVSEVKGHWRKK